MHKKNRGFALVLTLVTMVILFIVVAEYRWSTNLEIARSDNRRKMVKNRHIAQAGLYHMIEVLQKSKQYVGAPNLWYQYYPGEKNSRKKFFVGEDKNTFFQVSCQDEDGKVNLNFAGDELVHLFGLFGFKSNECKIFRDSILDWIDANDNHRINGKEKEYYKRLRPFYHCKNAPLENMNEIFLIHGIRDHNRRRFFGKNPKNIDLRKIATVYTFDNKVNINTTPSAVLETYLKLPPQKVKQLLDLRKEKKAFTTIAEAVAFLGQEHSKIKVNSRIFRIVVKVGSANSALIFYLEAIVSIGVKKRVQFLQYSEI